MNRDELLLEIETLIEQMTNLEEAFRTHPAFAAKLDSRKAPAIKAFLNKLRVELLRPLPTKEELAAEAGSEKPETLEEFEARKLSTISRKLGGATTDYTDCLMEWTKIRGVNPKEQWRFLVDQLSGVFDAFPFHYIEDKQLQAALSLIGMHQRNADGLIKKLAPTIDPRSAAVESALPHAIALLELSFAQQHLLYSKAKERVAMLRKCSENYQKVMDDKKSFLESVAVLRSLPEEVIAIIRGSNTTLAAEIEAFKKQVSALETTFPDSPEAYMLVPGNTFAMMEVATRNCKGEIPGLALFQRSLSEKLAKFNHDINESIISKRVDFDARFDPLNRRMEVEGMNRGALEAIRVAFEKEFAAVKPASADPILFSYQKLENLKNFITRLEREVLKSDGEIKEKLLANIERIKERITATITSKFKEIGTCKFTSEDEQRLVLELNPYYTPHAGPEAGSTYEGLKARYEQLEGVESAIEPIIAQMEERLVVHRIVKTSLSPNPEGEFNVGDLVRIVNTSDADGRKILATLGQYLKPEAEEGYTLESTFLTQLSGRLELFNDLGLASIKTFVEPRTSKEAKDIKEKLAFIDICKAKGINYKLYLDNPAVIAATLQLREWGYGDQIARDISPSFCEAINVLKKFEIKPTMEMVVSLKTDITTCNIIHAKVGAALAKLKLMRIPLTLDIFNALTFEPAKCDVITAKKMEDAVAVLRHEDANITIDWPLMEKLLINHLKCDAICQQAAYRNKQREGVSKMLPNTFKGLLLNILNEDSQNVIQALTILTEHDLKVKRPACTKGVHGILYLLKESPALATIICNTPLKDILPFLQPLLATLPHSTSLNPYFGNEGVRSGDPGSLVMPDLTLYGEIISALTFARNNKDATSLHTMSIFMQRFNKFIDRKLVTYESNQDLKNILKQFRRQVMPILLTPKSNEQKLKELENLASKTFKNENYPVNVFLDVLQFITGFFILIIPIRLALNQNALFSQEKSPTHASVSEASRDAYEKAETGQEEVEELNQEEELNPDPRGPRTE